MTEQMKKVWAELEEKIGSCCLHKKAALNELSGVELKQLTLVTTASNEKIEAFLGETKFEHNQERYSFTYNGVYFNRYDEDSNKSIEIPLIIDNRLAHTLGMTVDEIKSMDKNAAMRWSNKYPFFKYYRNYDLQWSLKSRYADGVTQEDMLLKAIFGEMANVDVK